MKKNIRKITFKIESCTWCTFKRHIDLNKEADVLGIGPVKVVCKVICALGVKELGDLDLIPDWCPLEKL